MSSTSRGLVLNITSGQAAMILSGISFFKRQNKSRKTPSPKLEKGQEEYCQN